ncbi:E3 SUMO-protein ligase NSE2-like [Diretmus argenteus]
MSQSAVTEPLSDLIACQKDIGTGMDIITNVAIDLVEAQGTEDNAGVSQMEAMILECAKMDREISCLVEVVKQVTAEQVSDQPPGAMINLSARVKEQFKEKMAQLSDAELQQHQKVVAFKDSIKNSPNQGSAPSSPRDVT